MSRRARQMHVYDHLRNVLRRIMSAVCFQQITTRCDVILWPEAEWLRFSFKARCVRAVFDLHPRTCKSEFYE